MIYHITRIEDWQNWRQAAIYQPPSLEAEGYIHCSLKDDIIESANRWFGGEDHLLLLCIDPSKLLVKIAYEYVDHRTTLMPHIYGPLNLEAVLEILPMVKDASGKFILPDGF